MKYILTLFSLITIFSLLWCTSTKDVQTAWFFWQLNEWGESHSSLDFAYLNTQNQLEENKTTKIQFSLDGSLIWSWLLYSWQQRNWTINLDINTLTLTGNLSSSTIEFDLTLDEKQDSTIKITGTIEVIDDKSKKITYTKILKLQKKYSWSNIDLLEQRTLLLESQLNKYIQRKRSDYIQYLYWSRWVDRINKNTSKKRTMQGLDWTNIYVSEGNDLSIQTEFWGEEYFSETSITLKPEEIVLLLLQTSKWYEITGDILYNNYWWNITWDRQFASTKKKGISAIDLQIDFPKWLYIDLESQSTIKLLNWTTKMISLPKKYIIWKKLLLLD